MDDIARLLGISKKTIYNLVTNKKGLVHAVVSAYISNEEKITTEIAANASSAIEEVISIARHVQGTLKSMKPSLTYDLKKYHPNTWQLIEKDHFNFVEVHIRQNLLRGIKEGFYNKNIRTDIIPKLFVNILKMVTEIDLSEEKKLTQSDIYESAILYHLNGIVSEKGRKQLHTYLKK